MLRIFSCLCPFVVLGLLGPPPTAAQAADDPLSRLVADAVERNPRITAARHDAEAFEARISPAGAWEDPTLSLGFMNLPTTSFDFSDDFMTMKVVQLGQRIPLPGQVGHRRQAASLRAAAADESVAATRVDVAGAMKRAYAELYYRDRALEIVERNLALLRGLEEVTQSRYATGVGRQPAVLRAGLEIDGLEAQRVELAASRHAVLARLNALRDRPASVPVEETSFPPALRTLAEPRGDRFAFVSALGIGSGEPGLTSPGDLPPLDSLVAVALEHKPELRAHIARIAAQQETVAHTRAMRWPAPQLTVGYGQRDGFPDMLNAMVSFRLPIFLGAKQGAAVREESAVLAREHATHSVMVAEIERAVTAAYTDVLDALGRLELYDRGILLRSEATLDATLAAYRSGSEDFLALLDSQARLYGFELERHRRIADLIAAWAELETAVGQEIEP
jgi:outer membrane protein TolC